MIEILPIVKKGAGFAHTYWKETAIIFFGALCCINLLGFDSQIKLINSELSELRQTLSAMRREIRRLPSQYPDIDERYIVDQTTDQVTENLRPDIHEIRDKLAKMEFNLGQLADIALGIKHKMRDLEPDTPITEKLDRIEASISDLATDISSLDFDISRIRRRLEGG